MKAIPQEHIDAAQSYFEIFKKYNILFFNEWGEDVGIKIDGYQYEFKIDEDCITLWYWDDKNAEKEFKSMLKDGNRVFYQPTEPVFYWKIMVNDKGFTRYICCYGHIEKTKPEDGTKHWERKTVKLLVDYVWKGKK